MNKLTDSPGFGVLNPGMREITKASLRSPGGLFLVVGMTTFRDAAFPGCIAGAVDVDFNTLITSLILTHSKEPG